MERLHMRVDSTRLHAEDAMEDAAHVINRVAYKRERIILHRRGKDVAAIIPIEDLRRLERLEGRFGRRNIPARTLPSPAAQRVLEGDLPQAARYLPLR